MRDGVVPVRRRLRERRRPSSQWFGKAPIDKFQTILAPEDVVADDIRGGAKDTPFQGSLCFGKA